MMFVDGESAEVLLVAYLIAGIATFAAAFLPGNMPLYRVICLMLGAVMAAWATKVMMFGGLIFVNALVLLGPVVLLIWGGAGMVRSIVNRPPARVNRPHPAARQLGSYQPHLPQAYAYGPSVPRQYQSGYANVHYEYSADPGFVPSRREAAAFLAHSRRELDVPEAAPPVAARHRRPVEPPA
ncbi:hypothetical protein [Dactylosporangium sp. CA-139066]|uniref:hypothetical protein n=1 Tax=Dactylosporangium sp. CA-139066 TaxID=3239930 RepID=UPI003D8EAA71